MQKIGSILRNHMDSLGLMALVALTIMLRIPTLEEPFDNDSASIEYHALLIMQGESLYGTHHPGHHFPGVYYTYVAIFAVLGKGASSIKLALIPWMIASAYLVYRSGIILRDRTAGMLAAIIFAFVTSCVYLKGTTGAIELFASLPRIAVVWLCMHLIVRNKQGYYFAFVGILAAIAFLYKPIYLSLLVIAFILLAFCAIAEKVLRHTLFRALWALAGFMVILVPVAAYFAANGLLGRLLLVFHFGIAYVKSIDSIVTSIIAALVAPIVLFGTRNPVLLILFAAGLWALVRALITFRSTLFGRMSTNKSSIPISQVIPYLCIVLWSALTFIEAGLGHPGYPNYNLLLAPPLSLIGAWTIAYLYDKYSHVQRAGAACTALALVLIIVGMCIRANYTFYHSYYRYKRGLGTYTSFLSSTFSGALFIEAKAIAEYVAARTSSRDYIYMWSDNTLIYSLAQRRPPTEDVWPIYADAFGPYNRIFASRTKYIIVTRSALREHPSWLYDQLGKHYHFEATLANHKLFRRNE